MYSLSLYVGTTPGRTQEIEPFIQKSVHINGYICACASLLHAACFRANQERSLKQPCCCQAANVEIFIPSATKIANNELGSKCFGDKQ